MMKCFGQRLVMSICIICCCIATAFSNTDTAFSPAIIPAPVKYTVAKERFTFSKLTSVYSSNAGIVKQLQQGLTTFASIEVEATTTVASNQIKLEIDSVVVPQKEGYSLRIDASGVNVVGHDAAGLFYGVQTLLQLVKKDGLRTIIDGCEIYDYPRFDYRGMHLDVSRHMFPIAAIKKWINILALYKSNKFHWHLTDDQGWRIEIDKYPRLQTVAAYRSQTLIGHKKELPHRFDGKKYGGYYTKQEVREIVSYAAERFITVIPEIEMPGHATAALAAYPPLGCTGGPYNTATFWGVFNEVYCAGNEQTFSFLQNVLDEVIELFPSTYIHIGGDECPKTRWKACPTCQQRMRDEHLKTEEELQAYFVQRIEKYLNTKNKLIIGWDEILEGGLAAGATVMSWRGEEGGIAAASQQHNVIMTPEKFVYLDYYQSLNPAEPGAAGGYLPLQKLYNYEPVPKEISPADTGFIKGVQANVWSEYLASVAHAEYMMFPRMFALAEMAWSQKQDRNYNDFLKRLRQQQSVFKKLAIAVPAVYDEITDTVAVKVDGTVVLKLTTCLPGADIYYTINGQFPTNKSELYTGPVAISKTATVRAILTKNKLRLGRIYSKDVFVSKATGKAVSLTNPATGNYAPANNNVLVNGITGTNRYNDGQWVGFSGNDCEAIIDLGAMQSVSAIKTNILKYHWQRMWEPTVLVFSVSDDGVNYKQVYRQNDFAINGINKIAAKFSPVKARYIKLFAKNKGVIPTGEYGAGSKAWLLLDEIMVY